MVDDSGSGYEPEGGSEGLSSGEENGSATQEWGETSPGGEDTFLALMEETDVDTSVVKLSQTGAATRKSNIELRGG
ncbi:hypothetical protein PC112_g9739 [Phytophthora cactorum]|nr:hypothetical protein PC112_g9739 [Phytophthora cactorum]